MFVGLTVQNFSQIGQVVLSHEWLQTDRHTDTHTDTHTPGSVFFPIQSQHIQSFEKD